MIPLSQPDITELEIDAVVSVMRSSRLSLGPQLQAFEERVAGYVGMTHGVAVSSGTAGLHLCIRALGIGAGDEVIVPSFTFIAAANAIRYEGATPVFVDIDAHTLNMDPAQVEAAVTPRTRAIMVVHTFGVPADLDALLVIAQRHRLLVIEDACEALGATWRGNPVGSFGDAAVFAFYPNKQITTGEGGIVVTRDEALARDLRALRNHGRYDSDAWHQHSILGYNYRLSEINCALGLAQMERVDRILEKRADAAETYTRLLAADDRFIAPISRTAHGRTSWFVYVARLAAETSDTSLRDQLVDTLAAAGIQCGRYFAPIHQQPAYSGWPVRHSLAITERVSRQTIALPFFTCITESQIIEVVTHLRCALDTCFRNAGELHSAVQVQVKEQSE